MFEKFENASGFIFDCDGTLLDTMKIWRQVERELIQMAGGSLSREDFVTLQAVSIEEGAVMLHERYGARGSAQEIVDYVDDRLYEFYQHEVKPREGAVEFVAKVRECGIPCSVVSSSPMRYLEAGMQHCGFIDELACIVSTQTAGFSKQEAGIYEFAVESMGATMQSTWAVDDSLYAIKAMGAAGLATIGIYEDDKAGTLEELSKAATIAVRSFTELLA